MNQARSGWDNECPGMGILPHCLDSCPLPAATSLPQVYLCLRNGWVDSARKAAERVQDISTRGSDLGFKGLLDEWLRNGGKLGDRWDGVHCLLNVGWWCRSPCPHLASTPLMAMIAFDDLKCRLSPPTHIRSTITLARECERLLRDKAALKAQLRWARRTLPPSSSPTLLP